MGLDSLELVLLWEEQFSILIPSEIAARLTTPELAAAAVSEILIASGRPLPIAEIEEIIRVTTLEISGMAPKKYRANGEFVRYF